LYETEQRMVLGPTPIGRSCRYWPQAPRNRSTTHGSPR
jgi:hypothetical protein